METSANIVYDYSGDNNLPSPFRALLRCTTHLKRRMHFDIFVSCAALISENSENQWQTFK